MFIALTHYDVVFDSMTKRYWRQNFVGFSNWLKPEIKQIFRLRGKNGFERFKILVGYRSEK